MRLFFYVAWTVRYLFSCLNYWMWTAGTIMFGGGKEEEVWTVILQILQPGPQTRHCVNGFAHFLPSTSIPLYNLTMCGTDNRAVRPSSSLQSVIECPISALLRSLQQLGWRRAPYKGCPRKREMPSAGTRAKIIHVGLECQKKPQLIYCHFQ